MRITPNDSDLDMMIAKFLINLPIHQQRQDRIWIHLQKLFYYFIDEVVDLQPLSDFQQHDRQMKEFFTLVVQKLPSFFKLDSSKIMRLISQGYSTTPVFGVIIFNLDQTKILLVQSHKPASMYGIPKGKINQNQSPIQCACRQVKQQVGINVQLSQNYKIQIMYNKSCCFYVCKMDEHNINVSFVKNTQAEKLKGKKKTSKEIKSLVWCELNNPLQLKLNVATKKVIEKIRSDKAINNGFRQNINSKINSNNQYKSSVNGYREIQNNSRKNNYVEVLNQHSTHQQGNNLLDVCPFDSYQITNRKMYQRLFFDSTD